jgi:hypothetical protein
MLTSAALKRRYFELRVQSPELSDAGRLLHVITFSGESPVERAVSEGLLKREHLHAVEVIEISREDCVKNWTKNRKNGGN